MHPESETFTCQVKAEFRSACKPLPFFGQHEGKQYCVLHLPGGEKNGDPFEKALAKKIKEQDFDFAGVYFPGRLDFAHFEFDKEVRFIEANFRFADFSGATFTHGANFSAACFREQANFFDARFGNTAEFNQATFQKMANFSATKFANVDFFKSVFRDRAVFYDARFDTASFRETYFGRGARFLGAVFEKPIALTDVTFQGDTKDQEIPTYIAGDFIALDPFHFVHEMNVVQVIAVFVNDGTKYEIELLGKPQTEGKLHYGFASGAHGTRTSEVQLEGKVEAEDPAGEYRCKTILVYTAGGEEVSFMNTPAHLAFSVMKEPTMQPYVLGQGFSLSKRGPNREVIL